MYRIQNNQVRDNCIYDQSITSHYSNTTTDFDQRNLRSLQERINPLSVLDVNVDIFHKFEVVSTAYPIIPASGFSHQLIGSQSSCQTRKDRRLKRSKYKLRSSRRTQEVDDYDDGINDEEIQDGDMSQNDNYAGDYSSADELYSYNDKQQRMIDKDLNEALFNNVNLTKNNQNSNKVPQQQNNAMKIAIKQKQTQQRLESPDSYKMSNIKSPGQEFQIQANMINSKQDKHPEQFSMQGVVMNPSQEQLRLKQMSQSNSQVQMNQQEQMINNLKEIQLKKKQHQQQQQQLAQLARLIEEQKYLEQLKEEAQSRGRLNQPSLEQIIEENMTQSSKDNTLQRSSGTSKISPSKKKLNMVKRKLQKAKDEGKDVKYMMRRSNSQKNGMSKQNVPPQSDQFTLQDFKKNNRNDNNKSINASMIQQQSRKGINISEFLNESKNEYANQSVNTSSFLVESMSDSNMKHSQSQTRFNQRDSNNYKYNTQNHNSIMIQGNSTNPSTLNFLVENSLNHNYSTAQLNQQQQSVQQRPISSKKKRLNKSKFGQEESPYNSQYQLRILHDFFDLDCYPSGTNNQGIPLLKVKKINRQSSQSNFHSSTSQSQGYANLNHSSSQNSFYRNQQQQQQKSSVDTSLLSEIYNNRQKSQQKQSRFKYDNQNNQSNNNTSQLNDSYVLSGSGLNRNSSAKKLKSSSKPSLNSNNGIGNIINTNHNQYVCFGVNIIKSDKL